MTDNHSIWLKKLDTVYYGAYVPGDILENILSLVNQSEVETVFYSLLDMIDWLLLFQIAQIVEGNELQAFLHNAEISYNNPDILEELTVLYPNLEIMLKQVVQRQLLAVYSGLQPDS